MATKTKPYFQYKQKAVNRILDLAWKLLTEANVPKQYPNIVREELEVYHERGEMNADEFEISWRGHTLLVISTASGEVKSSSKLNIRNAITKEEWLILFKAEKDIFRYGEGISIAWYFKCAVEEWYGNENELAFRAGSRWLRYAKAKGI
jgi:hypothetical protein